MARTHGMIWVARAAFVLGLSQLGPVAMLTSDDAGRSGAALAASSPAVFSTLSFEEALKANQTDGKLLIIKGTAVWCGPCKRMDRTTWVNDKVVQFVKDHGVAIAVDVDDEPKVARRLKIEAMPTIIAYRKGKEVDRVVGFQTAPQMLEWLGGVKEGKTRAQMLRERAGARGGDDGKVDAEARYDLAEQLLRAREYDKALEEYVWLWDNILEHEPSYVGVRGSFMAGRMEELAKAHEPAKVKFTQMRDALEEKLKARTSTQQTLGDWIVLNDVVGESDRTLAWYDRVKDDPHAARTIDRHWFLVENLLKEQGRWDEVGKRLDVDQMLSLQRMILQSSPGHRVPEDMRAMMSPEQIASFEDTDNRLFRDAVGEAYASLLAAGRVEDAQQLVGKAAEINDTALLRMVMIEKALDIGQVHESMPAMIDDAEKLDPKHASLAALRARVRDALTKPASSEPTPR